MGRLVTTSAETRHFGTTAAACAEGQGVLYSGVPTVDTEKQFDGSVCAKCGPSANNSAKIEDNATNIVSTLGRTYYFQAAVRFSTITPSGSLTFIGAFAATSAVELEVFINTEGKLCLWNEHASENVLTGVFAFTAEKHYLVEFKVKVEAAGNGTVALVVRNEAGTVVYESGDLSKNIGNEKIKTWTAGHASSAETATTIYVSHAILNDSIGEKENTYPGYRKIVALNPTADSARTGFLIGAAATTNLWKGVVKRPPAGLVLASKTAESQIYDATSNITDNYQVTLATYTAAGVGASDVVKVVTGLARVGNSSVTARSFGVKGLTNPEIGEITGTNPATVAGTDPIGWTTLATAPIYAPTVIKANAPTMQLRKNTASTDSAMSDMMAYYVDYEPVTTKSPPFTPRTQRNFLLRR